MSQERSSLQFSRVPQVASLEEIPVFSRKLPQEF